MRILSARSATVVVVTAAVLPRLVVLAVERGTILRSFVEKSDIFARTFVATGTYGFAPGEPSAYTQPLYGWFLIPLYWILGRHWLVVGLAQIVIAACTAVIVLWIGRMFLNPAAGLLAAVFATLNPYLIWHDVHVNREILDQLAAAALFLLVLLAARSGRIALAAAAGAIAGVAILGNSRLAALPLVLAAYLAWRQRGRALPPGRDARRRNARGDCAVGRAKPRAGRLLRDHDRRSRAVEGEQHQHLQDTRRGQVDRRRATTSGRSRPDTRIRDRDLRPDRPAASNQRVRPDAALRARDDQVLESSPW